MERSILRAINHMPGRRKANKGISLSWRKIYLPFGKKRTKQKRALLLATPGGDKKCDISERRRERWGRQPLKSRRRQTNATFPPPTTAETRLSINWKPKRWILLPAAFYMFARHRMSPAGPGTPSGQFRQRKFCQKGGWTYYLEKTLVWKKLLIDGNFTTEFKEICFHQFVLWIQVTFLHVLIFLA